MIKCNTKVKPVAFSLALVKYFCQNQVLEHPCYPIKIKAGLKSC